ncbi:hypothetical protein V7094_27540 [Priestia megaterium]|uniref:hypothetical protein n=1 Tax=Priestia megaterium TaxID=1404 RepID=UPI002FFEF81B
MTTPAYQKAQANYDTGTAYSVLHYETQVGQVKVMDASGNPTSDINEMLFNGMLLTSIALSTIKSTGLYRTKGATDAPSGMVATNTYIFRVEAVDVGSGVIVAHQSFYDHVNDETYHRTINGATVGSWVKIGKAVAGTVASIGSLTNLHTTAKTDIVSSINEVKSTTDASITSIESDVSQLQSDMVTHNHDTKYVKLTGGAVTGAFAVANSYSLAGKNTSGQNLTIGKVNSTNDVLLGDLTAKAIIQANSTDVSITDGTHTYKVIHTGNDGVGSGLDADMVDGIHGSVIAREDTINYFDNDQFIENSKSLVLRGANGSNVAGNLFFRAGDNTQKGQISTSAEGDLHMTAGNINGHTFHATGELFSTYQHELFSGTRENRVLFHRGASDLGIGHYMTTDGDFGVYDWQAKAGVFSVDRATQEVNFTKSIYVNGKKLTIQSTAPTNPKTGDIWIDI